MTKDKETETPRTFPAAVYHPNGESKLVNSQEEADVAEKDGWVEHPSQLPADPPAVDPPAHRPDRPKPEPPIVEPEPPARPKKKD